MNEADIRSAGGARAFATEPRSRSLWGLDWRDHFPRSFGSVTAHVIPFDEATNFIGRHYPTIFKREPGQDRFLSDVPTEAKRRFGNESDVFMLRDGAEDIGILVGHPSDWTTYYMRSVALLPEYREKRLLSDLVESTYGPLKAAGVERIEGDCSPANLAMMRALVNLGFIVNATHASERWGMRACFVKYLREDAEDVFVRQFCHAQTNSSRAR